MKIFQYSFPLFLATNKAARFTPLLVSHYSMQWDVYQKTSRHRSSFSSHTEEDKYALKRLFSRK